MIAEFLGLKRATVPSSSSAVSELFNYLPTQSGLSVGPNAALSYAPVWQAVSMISASAADLPLELREQTSPTQYRLASEHPAYQLVSDPHPKLGPYKFFRRHFVHALIWNRGYLWNANDGYLYHLLPDRTYWDEDAGVYVSEIDKQKAVFFPSEIIETEGPQIQDSNSMKLAVKFRESIALGLAAQGHNAQFFAKGGFPGGVLEIPPSMSPKAMDNLEEGWRKTYERQDAGFKTAILRDGAKFHQIMVNAEQTQMGALRIEQARDCARWFNLAPSRLGIQDSVAYNSKSEDNRAYYGDTLKPWLNALVDELWKKLLSDEERQRFQFRHNARELLMLDPKAHAELFQVEVEMGAASPNDYLVSTGRNPREGGDFYRVPLNYMILGDETPTDENSESAESPATESESEESDDQEGRAAIDYLESQVRLQINWFTNELTQKAKQKRVKFVPWLDSNAGKLIDDRMDKLRPAVEAIAPGKANDFESQIDNHFQTIYHAIRSTDDFDQVRLVANTYRNGKFKLQWEA